MYRSRSNDVDSSIHFDFSNEDGGSDDVAGEHKQPLL